MNAMRFCSLGLFTFVALGDMSMMDHDGHQHVGDYPDCQCITGVGTAVLDENCAVDQPLIDGLEEYLVENDCQSYCMNGEFHDHSTNAHTDSDTGFMCLQVYTNLLQFGDRCETGRVNHTLLNGYLAMCPDCIQPHYVIENGEECSGALNCTDTDDQDTVMTFIADNCLDSCTNTDCVANWREAEGYFRMCAHSELSSDFRAGFAENVVKTTCTDFGCNVPFDTSYSPNCTSALNVAYDTLRDTYGDLDLVSLVDESISPALYSVCTAGLLAVVSFLYL
mmetsp:Transcript_22521/g.36134  ORF Transcript_22521/g.36134 Transcript_22521/m.36134 type:complete len:279 (+) Transcript_22521:130-966(+)